MYIDLIVLVILVLIVIMFFKRFSSFVFLIAIIDTFLRILDFVKDNIGVKDVSRIIAKYFPSNMFEIISNYTNGTLTLILNWCFIVIMTFFLGYITKIFLKKKKI